MRPESLRQLLLKADDTATALAWTCHVLSMAGSREAKNVRLAALSSHTSITDIGVDRETTGAGQAAMGALDLLLRLVSGVDTSTSLSMSGNASSGSPLELGGGGVAAADATGPHARERVSAYEWCASTATKVLVEFLTVDVDSEGMEAEGDWRATDTAEAGVGSTADVTDGADDGDERLLEPRAKLRVRRQVRHGLVRLRRRRACTFLALASRPLQSALDVDATGSDLGFGGDAEDDGEEHERSMVCRCDWNRLTCIHVYVYIRVFDPHDNNQPRLCTPLSYPGRRLLHNHHSYRPPPVPAT